MQVLNHTPDELAINCPRKIDRTMGTVFMVIGVGVMLLMLTTLPDELRKPDATLLKAVGGPLCGSLLGACFFLPGLWLYKAGKDTLYNFNGPTRILRRTVGQSVEDISFDHVHCAAVHRDDDGDYGLVLHVKGRELLKLSNVWGGETPELHADAKLINDFLTAHR
jgi:hypothetical protein